MNATATILKLVGDGKARSIDDLKRDSGLSSVAVDHAVRKLREGNYLRSIPLQYRVTADGLARLTRQAEREKRAEEEAAQLAARKAARAATMRRPVGRPRMSDEEREAVRLRRLAYQKERRAAIKAETEGLCFVQRTIRAEAAKDEVVASAVASRPALQAAWGGAHA